MVLLAAKLLAAAVLPAGMAAMYPCRVLTTLLGVYLARGGVGAGGAGATRVGARQRQATADLV